MSQLSDLQRLTGAWRWLVNVDEYSLLSVSPFGDLFLKHSSGYLCLLDVNIGEVSYAETNGEDPQKLFPIQFDTSIANGYVEAGLMLAEGCCFGYKQPLIAGGSLQADNVYVADLVEYLDFMGHFNEETRHVNDGETVTIRVINTRKN